MMDAIDNPKQTQPFCTIKVSDYIKKNHKENKIRVGDDRKENQDNMINRQIQLLKEAVFLRDQQIIQLRNAISNYKQKLNKYKSVPTLESQNDYHQKQHEKYPQNQGITSKIEQQSLQLQKQKAKIQKCRQIISELQQRLKKQMVKSKNMQQNLSTEIDILKEELKYKTDEHERILDNLKINLQHNHQQRIKIIDNKYKKQLQIVNGELTMEKQLNAQKNYEILRLTQKIKKHKVSDENNAKFFQNNNCELRNSILQCEEKYTKQIKERQGALLAKFNEDLQFLHKEQKQEIILLCTRIRSLKKVVEDKESQIKQLWKMRDNAIIKQFGPKENIQNLCSNNKSTAKNDIKLQGKAKTQIGELRLSSLEKYLRN